LSRFFLSGYLRLGFVFKGLKRPKTSLCKPLDKSLQVEFRQVLPAKSSSNNLKPNLKLIKKELIYILFGLLEVTPRENSLKTVFLIFLLASC